MFRIAYHGVHRDYSPVAVVNVPQYTLFPCPSESNRQRRNRPLAPLEPTVDA
jgi:hypothetical protein